MTGYLIGGLAVLSLLVGLWVRHLHGTIEQQAATISTMVEQVERLEQQVETLSTQRSTLEQALSQAEQARRAIRTDLTATIERLRRQKPPTECQAAIAWAVERKDDLAW